MIRQLWSDNYDWTTMIGQLWSDNYDNNYEAKSIDIWSCYHKHSPKSQIVAQQHSRQWKNGENFLTFFSPNRETIIFLQNIGQWFYGNNIYRSLKMSILPGLKISSTTWNHIKEGNLKILKIYESLGYFGSLEYYHSRSKHAWTNDDYGKKSQFIGWGPMKKRNVKHNKIKLQSVEIDFCVSNCDEGNVVCQTFRDFRIWKVDH